MNLKSVNFPLIVLLIFSLRLIIFGSGIGEALALAALAGLYGWTAYLEHSKPETVNATFRKELDDIRSNVNSLKIAKTYLSK